MDFFVVGGNPHLVHIVPGIDVVPVVPVVPGGVLVYHGGDRRYTKNNPKITMCYRPNEGKDGLGLLTVTRKWSEGRYDHTNERTFDCEEDEYKGETIYVVSHKCSFPTGVRKGSRNDIEEVIKLIRKDGSENELDFPNRTGVWKTNSIFGNVLMIDGGKEGYNHLFYTLSGQKGWFNSKTKTITLKKVSGLSF